MNADKDADGVVATAAAIVVDDALCISSTSCLCLELQIRACVRACWWGVVVEADCDVIHASRNEQQSIA